MGGGAAMKNYQVNPDTTGLLLIDLQNGFLSLDGSLAREGENIEGSRRIIPHVTRLIEECRKLNIQDFWSIQEHLEKDGGRESHRITPHTKKRKVPPALRGTWDAEIIDEMKPFLNDGSEVFRKNRFSCFYQTNFEVLLRSKGIDTLIITGVSTPVCVETTVRDAYMRDFDLLIPEECVGYFDDDAQRASLKVMGFYMGLTLSLEELLELFPGSEKKRKAG
jgi:ureidoacrylate peracid hydrolase